MSLFCELDHYMISLYYWNSRYVFKEKPDEVRNKWKALGKTFLSYGFTGYILNNILLFVLVDMFEVSKYIAPLVTLIISVPVNFLLNKLWAFCDSA